MTKRNFDAVLLDVSLQGRHHPEIADYLLETNLPFAFVTGYDYLAEPRHEKVPVLQKPLAGYSAMGQETSESRRKPFQFARAIRYSYKLAAQN